MVAEVHGIHQGRGKRHDNAQAGARSLLQRGHVRTSGCLYEGLCVDIFFIECFNKDFGPTIRLLAFIFSGYV